MNNFFKNLGIGKVELIKNWLSEQGITNYELDEECRILANDVKIMVDGNLPEYINFKQVYKFTLCGTKNTISLRGCPEIVGDFNCSNCPNLKTLKGCPRIVYRNFVVENNDIENLKSIKKYPFFPQEVYRVCLYGNLVITDQTKQDLESKIYKICHTYTDVLLLFNNT